MKKLLIVSLLLGVASGAWASNDWLTSGTSTDWFTATNWSGGVVPSLSVSTNTRMYQTHMNTNYMPIILSGQNALSHQLDIGGDSQALIPGNFASVTLNSGSAMTITDYFRVGSSSSSNRWGKLYNNGGTVTVGGYFCLGYGATTTDVRGWLYMTSGTMTVGQDFRFGNGSGASGIAYLSGDATINAASLNMRPNGTTGSPTTLLDISGGAKVVLNGDVVATVLGYRDNGWILTGGEEFLDEYVTFDGTNTTLMVPEPATLCILAIGAFGLIRRK